MTLHKQVTIADKQRTTTYHFSIEILKNQHTHKRIGLTIELTGDNPKTKFCGLVGVFSKTRMTPNDTFRNLYARSITGMKQYLQSNHDLLESEALKIIQGWIDEKKIVECSTFQYDGQYVINRKK